MDGKLLSDDLVVAAEAWLEHLERRRRLTAHTIETYESSVRCFVRELPQGIVSDDDMAWAIARRMGPNASAAMRKRTWDSMSQLWRWWEQHGGPASPFADMVAPPKPDAMRRPLTEVELIQLVIRLTMATPRDRAMVLSMLQAGLRITDVTLVRVSDLDFAGGRLRARDGKGGTDVWLNMMDWLAESLEEWLQESGIDGGYVFPGYKGRCTSEAVRGAYKRVAGDDLGRAYKDGGTRPHMMRNTLASQLHELGLDLESLRITMRHRSIVTTQRYIRVPEERARTAMRVFDEKLRGLAS